jgi:hypothetical protein
MTETSNHAPSFGLFWRYRIERETVPLRGLGNYAGRVTTLIASSKKATPPSPAQSFQSITGLTVAHPLILRLVLGKHGYSFGTCELALARLVLTKWLVHGVATDCLRLAGTWQWLVLQRAFRYVDLGNDGA